ncbi:DUF3828 domain-containing protein [Xanthobacteraceae bacterium A53D]
MPVTPALAAPTAAASSAAATLAATTPEGLVRSIYAHYLETAPDTEVGFDFTDPAVAKVHFDAPLAKLLVADGKSETPKLDFDPFVDGQDFEVKSVAYTTQASGKTATVVAEFQNFDEQKRITFSLVRLGANWRISDVRWDEEPKATLLQLLKSKRQAQ